MSELIENASRRKALPKHMILQRHQGHTPGCTWGQYNQVPIKIFDNIYIIDGMRIIISEIFMTFHNIINLQNDTVWPIICLTAGLERLNGGVGGPAVG